MMPNRSHAPSNLANFGIHRVTGSTAQVLSVAFGHMESTLARAGWVGVCYDAGRLPKTPQGCIY